MIPSNRSTWDVCVVGGGPAAALAAGELASLGYSVAMSYTSLERSRPIESMTGLAMEMLTARNVLESSPSGTIVDAVSRVEPHDTAGREAPEAGSTSRFTIGGDRAPSRLLLVRRRALDAALRSWSVRRGVRLFESTGPWRVSRPAEGGGWRVASSDIEETLRAPMLVAATGRGPLLPARRVPSGSGLAAVAGFWSRHPAAGGAAATVRAAVDRWSWTASWPGVGVTAITFLSPGDSRLRDGDWRRACLQALACPAWISAPTAPDWTSVSAAGGFWDVEPAGIDWVKAGDSAFAVEPITNQGLQLALQSGAIAAACVNTLLRRPSDLALVTAFLSQRHASIAGLHRRLSARAYSDLAGEWRESPFWTDRCRKAPDHDATSGTAGPLMGQGPLSSPSPDDRVVMNPSMRPTRMPGCVGQQIVELEGLTHDRLATPLVYLEDVHIPPLLRSLGCHTRFADASTRWSNLLGAERASRVLAWLLRHDVIRAIRAR